MRRTILMARRKNIALVAHDNRKEQLLKWARDNLNLLGDHSLYATRTTGQLLKHRLGLNVTLLECGPLGGDQQIGSRISEGQIDFLIFFSTTPFKEDLRAFLRLHGLSGRIDYAWVAAVETWRELVGPEVSVKVDAIDEIEWAVNSGPLTVSRAA